MGRREAVLVHQEVESAHSEGVSAPPRPRRTQAIVEDYPDDDPNVRRQSGPSSCSRSSCGCSSLPSRFVTLVFGNLTQAVATHTYQRQSWYVSVEALFSLKPLVEGVQILLNFDRGDEASLMPLSFSLSRMFQSGLESIPLAILQGTYRSYSVRRSLDSSVHLGCVVDPQHRILVCEREHSSRPEPNSELASRSGGVSSKSRERYQWALRLVSLS